MSEKPFLEREFQETTSEIPGLSGSGLFDLIGEFDPGSESTLAACVTHASRTRKRGQLRE